MALEMKQGLKQSQVLQLSPQLQQAIKILLLTRQELEVMISDELRENPVLEEIDPSTDPGDRSAGEELENYSAQGTEQIEAEVERSEGVEDFRGVDDLFARLNDSLSPAEEQVKEASEERELPGYEVVEVGQNGLHDEIEEQIHMMHITPYERECAELVLQYIDDDGLLNLSPEEIAQAHAVPVEDVHYGLSLIKQCEPHGIGARSLQECLLLQLDFKEDYPSIVRDILERCWPEFERQDFLKIARALKVKQEEVIRAVQFIRAHLDPRPARQFGGDTNVPVSPDVFVFKRDERWVVSVNEDGLPRLRVSPKYASLIDEVIKAKNSKGGETDGSKLKSFLNEKIKGARWIMRALAERNRTILRVTEVIVERQEEFFEHGIEHLKPLTLKVVSEALGLHESTISRTTTGKYLHCPRGVFELKYFFNVGVGSSDGDGPANETVKNWVGEYIREERVGSVLSDQDIADLIGKEKGVKVARRTVAKYRESLGILPSSKRARQLQGS
jgi:RNA polymerase sigma-54 factor